MWDTPTACKKTVEYLIKERESAPHCVCCDTVLFNWEVMLSAYLFDMEYRKKKLSASMHHDIFMYVFDHYPYQYDEHLCRHHMNYAKNIQVPVCLSCHGKIHNSSDPKYAKWKPVDKKPKNQTQFDSNVYKPFVH